MAQNKRLMKSCLFGTVFSLLVLIGGQSAARSATITIKAVDSNGAPISEPEIVIWYKDRLLSNDEVKITRDKVKNTAIIVVDPEAVKKYKLLPNTNPTPRGVYGEYSVGLSIQVREPNVGMVTLRNLHEVADQDLSVVLAGYGGSGYRESPPECEPYPCPLPCPPHRFGRLWNRR